MDTRVLLLWEQGRAASEAYGPSAEAYPDAESRTRHPP
jgi:hypothetical protein